MQNFAEMLPLNFNSAVDFPLARETDSEEILMEKARWIAGFTLGEIAALLSIPIPQNLKRDKGWVGTLIETALGAKAGSKPEQDFAHLGIELKTIPINRFGEPLETTFVSLAPLTHNHGITWQSAHLRHKLQRVLWVPIEGEREIPLSLRHIGQPVLWSPDAEEERQLRQDWEELMELIVFGKLNEINATLGEVLQLRPKGRNRQTQTLGINHEGQMVRTQPLGFYLRKNFTCRILQRFLQDTPNVTY